MSKIDKLSISGVRSFSPLSRETIQFYTPLTLIVGYNGSGKTTIIECLKYATTGELPPNSKGGAFIHDPKLCGEREVLAQVKLKFTVPPETTYVVTRSLQLTVKKTTRSQKTLEGTLLTDRGGEKNSASSKVIALDTAVPNALGVAPAILDAVIFCHQDESLWPMSEPAALKKRFDEIFEAMKYTKAIENLKMLRKKQGEQLQQLKIFESQEKVNKERGEQCEKRSIALQNEIETLRDKCEELRQKMQMAEQNAREMHEQANSFLSIVNDLKFKKQQLSIRQENLEDTRSRMDELPESDDQLQDALTQHEERASRYQEDLQANISQYNQYQKNLTESRSEMQRKLAEQGMHQSDKAKYERQLAARVEHIHQTAELHSIRGFDGDLDDRKVQSFQERIQKLLADKKRELEHLQGENARDLDEKGAVITGLEGQKAQHTQNRVFARQAIAKIEKRIAALQRDLNSVEVDEGSKALLDSSFKDVESQLAQASQDLQEADFDARLREEESKLHRVEAENSKLGRELVESTRLLADRAQLDVRKMELVEKKRKLDTLTSTWSSKISSMVNGSWEPSTIDREFHKALQLKNEAYDEASRKRDDVVQQFKQVQFTRSSSQAKAKKRGEEIERCKSAVLGALKAVDPTTEPSVDKLPLEIERLEDVILTLEKDMTLFEHLKEYYMKCQKTLNKQNRCELCDRTFADAGDKSRLVRKIKEALEDAKKEEMQTELAEYEELLGNLRAVRPQSELYTRLMAEKEESDREIRVATEREESMVQSVEEMDEVVRVKQEEKQDLESMSKTVLNISQTCKEIEEAEAQVERIMTQQQSSGAVRSTQEIHELQDRCAEQMRAVKSDISKLSSDKQRMRDLINSLELERSRLSNRINNAVRQLERKKDFEDQIEAQKDDMNKQKEAIQQADHELTSVMPEIAKARTIREDTLQRGRAKEKKAADERDGFAASANELRLINTDIQDYLDRGGPSLLAANERAIQALDKSIKRIEKDMNDLAARTNKLKEEIATSAGNKKNILDNLNYRKTIRDIERLREEIEELESRNANEDYERLDREAKLWESQRHVMNAERGSTMGTMRSKDEELARLLQEWETDYREAAHKYRETHIKVETTKAAIEDLGKYGAALNNAIMKYHALKMEEVNRIAGELWQSTYQGTDIDTILIKSDSETATGRSSYNYRVCMVKQDTEMDMRGRCSAGQKVLASIIIRLALAESFGIGCGLIALDEPTTNLDRDNIRSLAESLHAIIKARKAQANFQLIVITHDEEFLRHMRCSDFCDYFWRVKRDDRQNSVIERESISNVV
ncbi:putative RAD50 protein [Durotheca rogersii]|uniref:putative RAD50 protein n=1 Tax=Durotheca rogersii TaxID=419775 RepID=UPI00221EBD8E|nr:putative RAD50 protein [Durotheca rogersii]KAI5863036.1 putative RAD50 protein [Durotheca rogersii]